jgi:hypothetical protein
MCVNFVYVCVFVCAHVCVCVRMCVHALALGVKSEVSIE